MDVILCSWDGGRMSFALSFCLLGLSMIVCLPAVWDAVPCMFRQVWPQLKSVEWLSF